MRKMLVVGGLAFLSACGSNWIVPQAPSKDNPETSVVDNGNPNNTDSGNTGSSNTGSSDAGCPLSDFGVDTGSPSPGGFDAGSTQDTDAGTGDVSDAGTPPSDTDGGTDEGGGDAGKPKVCGPNKIEVCHIPRGNPENLHTICVGSENAANAHVAHGDRLGQCEVN